MLAIGLTPERLHISANGQLRPLIRSFRWGLLSLKAAYPQPNAQKKGFGFPIAHAVEIFLLSN